MTATERELELRVSNAAYGRISDWLRGDLRDSARSGVFAAVYLAGASLLASFVLFMLLFYLQITFFRYYASEAALILPAVVIAAMYPAYFFWGRQPYRRVELDSGEVRIPVQFSRPLALVETSDTADTAWRDWMFFPAWLTAKAIHQAQAPMRAARADTRGMARLLVHLLERNRRVSLHDLENELRLPNTAALLNSLTEIDGVLFFHADFPAVSLNDDLRRKVMSFL